MLGRAFYDRPVLEVAPDLLGRVVAHAGVAVLLTEVEAYAGTIDPGSHAYRGCTPRTAVMFGPPGHAYVYLSYGMHWCMNLVCAPPGTAAAVLLRAGEVVGGGELARERRGGAAERDLARGPARLTRALAVDGSLNGVDVVAGAMTVHVGSPVARDVLRAGPRVGLRGGALLPWRFWVDGAPSVSNYRPAGRRRHDKLRG